MVMPTPPPLSTETAAMIKGLLWLVRCFMRNPSVNKAWDAGTEGTIIQLPEIRHPAWFCGSAGHRTSLLSCDEPLHLYRMLLEASPFDVFHVTAQATKQPDVPDWPDTPSSDGYAY